MLVDVWRGLEAAGFRPSVREVIALVRTRLRFRTTEAFELLKSFREPFGKHSGSENHARGNHPGSTREPPTRARKGITSYKESATQTSLLANGKAEKAKKPRAEPKPGHLILDAVAPLVAPHLEQMTVATWRRYHATAAHAMAEGGITPEQAAAAWQAEFERTQHAPIVLRYLHDRMAVIATQTPPQVHYPSWRDVVDDKERNGSL